MKFGEFNTLSEMPDRLRINHRAPDNTFDDPLEELYRGLKPGFWPPEANPLNLHFLISLPELCLARSKYCESPTDVFYLAPQFNHGVVCWVVGNIPPKLDIGGTECYLVVKHIPDEAKDFYPHVELHTCEVPNGPPVKFGSKTFKSALRMEIAKLAQDPQVT